MCPAGKPAAALLWGWVSALDWEELAVWGGKARYIWRSLLLPAVLLPQRLLLTSLLMAIAWLVLPVCRGEAHQRLALSAACI